MSFFVYIRQGITGVPKIYLRNSVIGVTHIIREVLGHEGYHELRCVNEETYGDSFSISAVAALKEGEWLHFVTNMEDEVMVQAIGPADVRFIQIAAKMLTPEPESLAKTV